MSTVNDLERGAKTPGQMLKYCAMVLAVPIIVIIFLVKMNMADTGVEGGSLDSEAVFTRIAPVAKYNTGVPLPEEAADANKGPLTGEQVYKKLCITCHETGLAGAPKFGDKAAWGPRIAVGQDDVFSKALNGFNGMPAKGGDASLSDLEVKRAVVWMVNHAGGEFPEPSDGSSADANAAESGAADKAATQDQPEAVAEPATESQPAAEAQTATLAEPAAEATGDAANTEEAAATK